MIKTKEKNQEMIGNIYLSLNVLLAGVFPVVGKLALNKLDAITVLAGGTFFAFIYFAIIITIKKEWRQLKNIESKKDIFWAIFIIGFLYQIFYFIGLNATTPGNAVIISLSEIFFSYLFFHIWRKENFSIVATAGLLLIALGVVIVLSPKFNGFHYGDFLILFAASIAPSGNYFQRKVRGKMCGNMLMLLRSFCGFIIFGIISFLIPTKVSQNEITSALPLLIINGILMLG
ncbi:MAG TPA: DMT family transporter, partial [Patescibacteria group bacterium]